MSLNETKEHLNGLRRDDFDPRGYEGQGYALRTSVRCDGFRLQLLAYKLKELHSAILPNRLTSTVAGVVDHLKDVHNVIRSGQDVTDLWGCPPQFQPKQGLTSLHGKFIDYFAALPMHCHIAVQCARALGYLVVGVNEFLTMSQEDMRKKCHIKLLFANICFTRSGLRTCK
ncbi:hypothetical protein BGZ65_000768 [Modicella reniformis]|uniref:Uncharacterized protein n=1 Tax=Modicella reniformis TaxID=1440133 RepID=A0A9P6MA90_9FUNG|nr:hypothetical protein BGZ65_000768 [Modicella reniformis]